MAITRPLGIAIAAFVLLVGSVGFEVAFHRTYTVDVRDGDSWRPIATNDRSSRGPYAVPFGAAVTPVDGNVTFRLRVANGYPWGASEHYRVLVDGAIAAEGDLSVGARGEAASEFHVSATRLTESSGGVPTKGTDGTPARSVPANLYVEVGTVTLYPTLSVREAS